MATTNNVVQSAVGAAGDIQIDEAVLVNAAGVEVDIKLFIGELNIFEDMFSMGLAGNLLVIDNLNLPEKYGIVGDELLRLKLYTPSMRDSMIHKTFKVYSITDKMMTNDSARQSYIMHFCSPEILIDALSPIYKTFRGRATDIAKQIFSDHLATSRNGGAEYTGMVVIGQSRDTIKYNSPGWRPSKNLNWLASRCVSPGFNNPGYLFYESNKSFYFANYEELISRLNSAGAVQQEYIYAAADTTTEAGGTYINDVNRQYKTVQEFRVIEGFNSLKNSQNGYLANRLYTLDMVTKEYGVYDYDHVNNYAGYHHMEDKSNKRGSSIPPFVNGDFSAIRSPKGFSQVYLKHFGLHTGYRNNVNDVIEDILPRRTSTLNELQNLKIEITVPGRTDAEIGNIVYFIYPDSSPRDASDLNKPSYDKLYTGKYMVTAIRHKINLQRHIMIMELVKDSYAGA